VTELDEEGLCVVSLCAAEGVGPATVARLRQAAHERGLSLRAIMALSRAGLQRELALTPPAAKAVADIKEPVAAGRSLVKRLARIGIRAVPAGCAGYPERLSVSLGYQAPPLLFLAGDESLLRHRCLAIVGSREPSKQAADAARSLAGQEAAAGTTIVSGGAHGIDTAAHIAAASSGGTAVVPAVGLARFRWLQGRAGWLHERRWCAIGQFPPEARWRAGQALIRNRTIVALSEAVVAFEPRDSGGTWHSSVTALRMGKPLFLVSASRQGAKGRGFRQLVRHGAVALDPLRMPDGPALARLIAEYRPLRSPDQLALFGCPES